MRRKFMRFPQGKTKVVTLSYDDCIEEDEFLIQLMEKYKIKGTFNLIPAWFAQEGTTYPEGESYEVREAVRRCMRLRIDDGRAVRLRAGEHAE